MPNQEKRTRQTEKEELNTKDTAEEIETKEREGQRNHRKRRE